MTEQEITKLLHHKIVVNEYFTIDFKMPETISILEFKGLMLQAEKFFKVGQMELFGNDTPGVPVAMKRKYVRKNIGTQRGLTDTQKQSIRELYKTMTRKQVAEKIGCTDNQVLYVLKLENIGKNKSKTKRGRPKKSVSFKKQRGRKAALSNIQKKYALKHKDDMTSKEIAKHFGNRVSSTQVKSYIHNWRNGNSSAP